ncbi:MAG: hypothetical protein M3Q52_08635 [Pseudomonadota bacterium]|nr:hypothetical protein [Pseudomonadota bacterium]
MSDSQLRPPAISILRVICDKCRAEGVAGDPAFAAIPDILSFDPVPVRSHANNWTAEHQRAFIAALAMTGSVNQAARAIGRYSGGADRLRKARGGRAFSEAWDVALEIARDRDLAEMHANLRDSSRSHASASARAAGDSSAIDSPHVRRIYGDDYDPDEYLEGHAELVDARGTIRDRLLQARRLYLAIISSDADSRAAWEVLCGPVDWDLAERHQPQPNEPYATPNLRKPDMLVAADNGLLPDLVGGPDLMEEIERDLQAEEAGAAAKRDNRGDPR